MDIVLLIIILLIFTLLFVLLKEYAPAVPYISKIILSCLVILFVASVVIYPAESFSAAFEGLNTWFNVVCPSLLPFFIGSDLLINLGIVGFIGSLLEPVMRPVFNVPGCGSFPLVMSITSGYPVGPKVVVELYKNRSCTKTEAQRMLSFCSTSGPLFMIGAVAVGMLHFKESGTIIALSNYLGAIAVGLIFRFYKVHEKSPSYISSRSMKRTIKGLIDSFKKDNKPFGLLLGSAVKNSIDTLLLIGGLIVLFSVIIKLLTLSGFINVFSKLLCLVLKPIGVSGSIITPASSGLFEITIGSKMVSSSNALMTQKIVAISGIIAWSGLSVHAQVASIMSMTDLSFGTYIISKVFHSLFTFIFASMLISAWGIFGITANIPVFGYEGFIEGANLGWATKLIASTGRYLCIVAILGILSVIYNIASRSSSISNR